MNRNSSELDGETGALLEELSEALDAYVAQPSQPNVREAVARSTAELLRRRPSPAESLWQQLRIQARFLPWWYYTASAALCALGVALLRSMQPDAAARFGVVIGMVPLPALLGLLEVFHGMDEGMGEIESACRYSPASVMSARMLIVGLLSSVLAATLGCMAGISQGWLAAGIVVVPFCMSSALGLLLSAALRGRASSAQVVLAIAFANAAIALMATQDAHNPLLHITSGGWAAAIVFSVFALSIALRILLSKHSKLVERKLLQWN